MESSHQSEGSSQAQNVYERFDQYPWDSDAEFQNGLNSILAQNQSAELVDDLTLRARCFYYLRKTGTDIDGEKYKSWKRQKRSDSEATERMDAVAAQVPPVNGSQLHTQQAVHPTMGSEAEPPRLSYQEVVDLIQSGKPVPGIKEIPNTILEGQGTQSTQPRRKKPWEKDSVGERQPLEAQWESANG